MTIINSMNVVRTIAAFEKEIGMQVKFLENFDPPRRLSYSKQKKAVFCGAGDSFASSQLAEVFSRFRIRAIDPLDAVKNREIVEDSDLYLVSVSGNTISNIKLAKLVRNCTAITSNKKSKLAKICKNTILMNFQGTGIQTAGSISFLASALVCLSLVSRIEIDDPGKIFDHANRETKKTLLQGRIYILGNLYTMPVAMFCAAKLHEVLGADARYERIEQFSHMGLFSVRRGDTIIIFEEKNTHNEKLVRHLKDYGLNVWRFEPKTRKPSQKILFFIFVSEMLALNEAKREKRKDCFFITSKKLRNISSSMIY